MTVVKKLTNVAKISLLKNEINRLILKNDGAPVLDATFNKVFDIVVDKKAIDQYINGAQKLPSNKEVAINASNMKNFNWNGLFTKSFAQGIIEDKKPKTKKVKDSSSDVSIDHLEPERYEYMVLDPDINSTWSLKIIDLQKIQIKKDDNIFNIIDKHDFRDPLELMNQVYNLTDGDNKKEWKLFGTVKGNYKHLIFRAKI
ncbi:hypothetical protein FOG51_00704 [Hanseniaspora uvarum]|uniref:Uncharacterized protein n=1 Tax=Hanseniaspora uvarum TaxID=29833 RepID=A0A1E5RIH6_HANUV|nr:hypothetical protein FOG48_01722 [Hanseniaspora uvarum]KAF0274330.1 hypothetical protein FOG51_00704 [Hanseniaspora uvarum]KAF0276469.1 hypothetical protein FOG50_02690 [Hanseniaspora uvarum]KKA01321.1 hypothetical protein D499_0AH00400 [Hanseniaspora uvarum DSM 2768]OEJ86702.1 hypothetical protein AWRI3580_g3126 [Hanseniaspora uvarum]